MSRCHFNKIDVITDTRTTWSVSFGNFATIQIIINEDNFFFFYFEEEFPRRIDVIISTWIRLSKLMKSRRTFHVEFRRWIDGEWCVHSVFLIKFQDWKSAILFKKRLTQVFSCEYCEIFLKSFSMENLFIIHLRNLIWW